MTAHVGFAELGRVMSARADSSACYPSDGLILLTRLARAHPSVAFHVFSRTRGERYDLPDNVVWPRFESSNVGGALQLARDCICGPRDGMGVDGVVVFLNQHSSSAIPNALPKLSDPNLKVVPLQLGQRSVAPVLYAVNAWQDADPTFRRDPIYLVNDCRSMLAARDLKWPPRRSIIAQFDAERDGMKHYRFTDPRSPENAGYDSRLVRWSDHHEGHWESRHLYRYGDLDVASVTHELEQR